VLLCGITVLLSFFVKSPFASDKIIYQMQIIEPALLKYINRFIFADYFNKLRELLMRLDVMDKTERIYSVDGRG
jgi:hypothetical protein